MTVPRTSPSVAAANGLLYVIGGDQNRQLSDFYRAEITVSAVEVFDPLSGEWSDSAPLPESRSEPRRRGHLTAGPGSDVGGTPVILGRREGRLM